MVKIKIWGPITWNLLHTIAEKIYPDKFLSAKKDIATIILLIIKNIPCPICREHAEAHIKRHDIFICKTRDELINYIFIFHNETSKHAKNQIAGKDILTKYKKYDFNIIVNQYMFHYKNTRSDDLKFSFSKIQNLKQIFNLLINNTNNFTC